MIYRDSMTLWALAAVAVMGAFARADVNLEWRPASQTIQKGQTVDIGLYAVGDEPTDTLAAMDVIFAWESGFFQLQELDNTGAVPLMVSEFPTLLDYNLNEVIPPQDGDGLYRAKVHLGTSMVPSTDGILLTTFRFLAGAANSGATLTILPTGGDNGVTVVFGSDVPGDDVTGTLGSATVEILDGMVGDLDNDGDVDLDDYSGFADCLNGPGNPTPPPGCTLMQFNDADLDNDVDVDLEDFSIFELHFTG